MVAPTIIHHQAAQRVLRYIKGSLSQGLFFSAKSFLQLKAFSDFDWARCVEGRNSGRASSVWFRDIIHSCSFMSSSDWFRDGVRRSVGSGASIHFWDESWAGTSCFRERFARLYLPSEQKNSTIADCGVWHENRWEWVLRWRRVMFVWEEGLLDELMALIVQVSIDKEKLDGWNWEREQSGGFTTKSAYAHLEELALGDQLSSNNQLGVFKLLWECKAPTKIGAFAWRVLLNRIPTKQNLAKRGVQVSFEDQRYVLCGGQTETEEHLFLYCPLVTAVWCSIYAWLGVSGTHYQGCLQHFLMLEGLLVWMLVWMAVFWTIWLERNEVIFNNKKTDVLRMVDLIKTRSWSWFNASTKGLVAFS